MERAVCKLLITTHVLLGAALTKSIDSIRGTSSRYPEKRLNKLESAGTNISVDNIGGMDLLHDTIIL